MKKNVYFGKVSLVSDDVIDVPYNESLNAKLTSIILGMFSNSFIHREDVLWINEDGERYTLPVEYTMLIQNKTNRSVEGVLYRKARVYVHNRESLESEQMISRGIDNTEAIQFYYDVVAEYIAFMETRRFKRRMFVESIARMLNCHMETLGHSFRFSVDIFNEGVTVEEIKALLKKAKNIVEVELSYRLPNPDEAIMERIMNSNNDRLKQSGATHRTLIYKTSGQNTINGCADIIQEDVSAIETINKDIPFREMTRNGYARLVLKLKNGIVKTTADEKPLVRRIRAIEDFVEIARDGIAAIITRAIDD